MAGLFCAARKAGTVGYRREKDSLSTVARAGATTSTSSTPSGMAMTSVQLPFGELEAFYEGDAGDIEELGDAETDLAAVGVGCLFLRRG